MAGINSYSLSLTPVGLLMITIIYRADSNGKCGGSSDDPDTIYKEAAVGSSLELSCNVTDSHFVAWTLVVKTNTVKVITIGKLLFSQRAGRASSFSEDYSIHTQSENITTSSNESYVMYNLLVHNFTEDREGIYTCHDRGCNKAKVKLFIKSAKEEPQHVEKHKYDAGVALIWTTRLVLIFWGVIIVSSVIGRVVFFFKKERSTAEYSTDENKSSKNGVAFSTYRKPPTLSRHQFVDISEKKYEKYIQQEEFTEMERKDTTTTETSGHSEEEQYLQILE